MECQKMMNLLGDETNQPSKFRTRNWVEINDESQGNYDNGNIKLKKSMIWSNLCDYSNAYILVSRTIEMEGATVDDAAKRSDESNKGAVFKNCAPFIE